MQLGFAASFFPCLESIAIFILVVFHSDLLVGGLNPSENICQNGNLPQIGVQITNIWNNHPVIYHGTKQKKHLNHTSLRIMGSQVTGGNWRSQRTLRKTGPFTPRFWECPMILRASRNPRVSVETYIKATLLPTSSDKNHRVVGIFFSARFPTYYIVGKRLADYSLSIVDHLPLLQTKCMFKL